MALSIETKIIDGLTSHFDAIDLPDGMVIVYPGFFYTPDGSPFVRLSIEKNNPTNWHVGGGREPIRQGLFMAAVFWPVGTGIIDASELAGSIRNSFAFNTIIDHDGIRIRIADEPSVSGDIEEDDYVQIPVIVPWMVGG